MVYALWGAKETLLSNAFLLQLMVLKISVLGIQNEVQRHCKIAVKFFLNKPNVNQLFQC